VVAAGAGGERDGADDHVEQEEERRRGEVAADQRPRVSRRRERVRAAVHRRTSP